MAVGEIPTSQNRIGHGNENARGRQAVRRKRGSIAALTVIAGIAASMMVPGIAAADETTPWTPTLHQSGVELVNPRVVQASCNADGTVAPATVSPVDDTEDMRYELVGTPVAGGSVTVNAYMTSHPLLFDFPDTPGWTISADRQSASINVALAPAPDCSVVVAAPSAAAPSESLAAADENIQPFADVLVSPVDPRVRGNGTCSPTVEVIFPTEDWEYTIAGEVKPGAIVIVTATSTSGKTFPDTEGWVVAEDRLTATFTVTLEDAECDIDPVDPVDPTEPTNPETPTVPEQPVQPSANVAPVTAQLATTGGEASSAITGVVIATLLAGAGALTLAFKRRRTA